MAKYDNIEITEVMTSIKKNKANDILQEWLNIFIKYYSKLLNSREVTGLTTLKAKLFEIKIKLTTNSKLTLHAEGICKDFIFKNTKIE